MCVHCGKTSPESARMCIQCGKPVQGNPCPQCKRTNRPQSVYCAHCGSILSGIQLDHPYETGRLPAKVLLKERYFILKRIAQGGMGAIYLAADTKKPGLRWAVKEMSYAMLDLLNPARRDQVRANLEESFKREFEILHQSRHPNLPIAEEYFEEMGRPYIVMEYIDGQTLEKILEEGKPGTFLPQERVIKWAQQICDVFHYLHSQNPPIIYRDLKPSNVMEENKSGNVKLIDFGIARFYKPGKKGDTARFGTEGYLAPEILSSIDQTNPATDIYSLGAMLHQMLTNREPSLTPFVFPPVRTINPAVNPQIEKVIARAVEPNTIKRPQTALEMKQELSDGLTQTGIPTPQHTPGVQQGLSQTPVDANPRVSPLLFFQPANIRLGQFVKNQTIKPFAINLQSPAGTEIHLGVEGDWLHVEPGGFLSPGYPVQVQLQINSRYLHWSHWQPKPGTWLSRLPRFLKAYFNLHFHLVPGGKSFQSRIFASAQCLGTTDATVNLELRPPRFLVLLGWLLALGLMGLELLLLSVPIIFIVWFAIYA